MLDFLKTEAILKTPLGKISAKAGEAFDGHPAIVVCLYEKDGSGKFLAEIRYNPRSNTIESGVYRDGDLVADFTKQIKGL